MGAAHRRARQQLLDVLLRRRSDGHGVPHPPRDVARLHVMDSPPGQPDGAWTASKPATRWCFASATGGSCTTRRRASRKGDTTSSRRPSLMTWTHWSGRHEVYRDPMTGTMAGPTESPFVCERDGTYYLLIGPDYEGLVRSKRETGRYDRAAYRRTRVIASDDPLSFDLADQVATIDAHAAEVVRDESGGWWVSHCGWGQGGVYLAPLTWTTGHRQPRHDSEADSRRWRRSMTSLRSRRASRTSWSCPRSGKAAPSSPPSSTLP